MASNIIRLFDFASSSPMAYYHKIGSQYFTQIASSPALAMSLFLTAKATELKNKNVAISYTLNRNDWRSIKTIPISPAKTYNSTLSSRYSLSIVPGNRLTTAQLLLILLLITAVGISQNEVHAAELSVDQQLEMVSYLLEQNSDRRTTEQKIILFNSLLSLGTAEADKAKGKDVVLFFGNTGAGKSTLINTIYGCKMAKDADKGVIVDPKSPVPEVAPIGRGPHSCTFIPKEIPGIIFTMTNTSEESVSSNPREISITCFDMPGLSDDRGIEVTLANTVIMQRVVENARSVRFVMVFEEPLLTAEHGSAWKKAVKLLSERFNGCIGGSKKSLCLVITKGSNNLDIIRKNIKNYTPDDCLDLSSHVTVYDPLNPESREHLLNRLCKTKCYKGLDTNITMGGDQLWEALKLGEQIQREIVSDLKEADGVGIDKAIKKIEFTHGIKKLNGKHGDKDLAKPHDAAEKAVREYTDGIIKEMKHVDNTPKTQIVAYKEYQKFKGKFEKFVGFEAFDKQVEKIKYTTKDPRWLVAWDQSEMSTLSGAVTVSATVAAVILSSPAAAIAAVVAGSSMIYSVKRWLYPTQDEKDMSEFCRK